MLQRIGICYGAAAFLVYFLNLKQLVYVSIALLLGYWLVLWGFGDYSLENNAVRKLDLLLFGENHLYGGDGIPFDPEGFLSTFPAIVNAIGGYLVGRYLLKNTADSYQKIANLLMIGCALMATAHFWDYLFPINKKLWTSSYVLLTIGLDLAILATLIFATDIKKTAMNYHFFEIFLQVLGYLVDPCFGVIVGLPVVPNELDVIKRFLHESVLVSLELLAYRV